MAGIDFDQATFPDHPAFAGEPHILVNCFLRYIAEKTLPNTRKPENAAKRVAYAAKKVCEVWGFDRDITTLKRADCRLYRQRRLAEGVGDASIRRELSMAQAAVRHAAREERILAAPQFELPEGSDPRIRFLTEDEHRKLMALPMEGRLRRFFRLAFGTGARSEAIMELTWSRVDMVNRLIDFRVAGVRYKNKRRAVVPISDELYRQLEAMAAAPGRDEFVVGRGPSGRNTSTHHLAKRAMKAIGIDETGVSRHVARHTFASWRLQRGVPVEHVAALMGDTPAMVTKVYGHLLPHHLVAAANMRLAA